MTSIQSVYDLYRKLRREGMVPGGALEFVREDIAHLSSMHRTELVKMVRDWEARHQGAGASLRELKPEPPRIDNGLIAHDPLYESPDSTSRLDTPDPQLDTAFFGSQSTLILIVKGTNAAYRLQPQLLDHDAVIGRSADTFAVLPDIDLLGQQGAQKGVSRGHAAIRFDKKRSMLHVVDLDSANGTFVNNLRLYPQEVRALRHGDELRLGRLTMQVYFQH